MWFVKGGRASGKTTMLIQQSAMTGNPILVINYPRARILKERARSLGLHIPEPLVWKPDGYYVGVKVLIDDGEETISKILYDNMRVQCEGMAISGPLTVLDRPLPKEMAEGLPHQTLKRLEAEALLNGKWRGGCCCMARGNMKSHACAGIGPEEEEEDAE